jgi:hypothetical protein
MPANRLVDTSASLALAGATQLDWNQLEIADAAVGTHVVEVRVGNVTKSAEIRVASTADSIQPLVAAGTVACFAAYSEGAFISGLAWQFTSNGEPLAAYDTLGPNCVIDPSGSPAFTVTATAGGRSLTVTTAATGS